jgi:hypothetical protein
MLHIDIQDLQDVSPPPLAASFPAFAASAASEGRPMLP